MTCCCLQASETVLYQKNSSKRLFPIIFLFKTAVEMSTGKSYSIFYYKFPWIPHSCSIPIKYSTCFDNFSQRVKAFTYPPRLSNRHSRAKHLPTTVFHGIFEIRHSSAHAPSPLQIL